MLFERIYEFIRSNLESIFDQIDLSNFMNIFSVRKWIQFVGYSDGLILNDLKFLDIIAKGEQIMVYLIFIFLKMFVEIFLAFSNK